jgi:hypothetical protein
VQRRRVVQLDDKTAWRFHRPSILRRSFRRAANGRLCAWHDQHFCPGHGLRRPALGCPVSWKPQRRPRIRWLIPGLSCRVTMAFTVRAVHRLAAALTGSATGHGVGGPPGNGVRIRRARAG